MSLPTIHSTSRGYLKDKFEERTRKNRAYSLRAFARAAGIAPSYLSSIFSGAKNISLERAEEISQRLHLSSAERAYFVQLVELEWASSTSLREQLENRLLALQLGRERQILGNSHFSLLAKWYYPAILAMADLQGQTLSPELISRRLGLAPELAAEALAKLVSSGWLEGEARSHRRRCRSHVLLKSEQTNQVLRTYHQTMLRLIERANRQQTPPERITRTETLAINKAQLPNVRRLTEEFIESVVALAQQGSCSDVFHLNLNFINLTPETIIHE